MDAVSPSEILARFAGRYPALQNATTIGVASSGGADSSALAYLACALWPGRVTLLHMNYGLRGEASDADEELVRHHAAALGCGIAVRRVRPEGRSEEELRRLRYEWFEACPQDVILTAHTLEDQAETLLFRIVRGTGPGGLSGIQPVLQARIYRPLLEVRREDLHAWLVARGIAWREDESNADTAYRRNWIRHELLPELVRELNPAVSTALSNLAEITREDEEWIAAHVEQVLGGMARAEGSALILECRQINELPGGLRRRVMRAAMARVKGNLREIEFLHVEAALRLCGDREGSGRLQVPALDLMRSFDWLRIVPIETLRNLPLRNFRVAMPVPGEVEIPEGAGWLSNSLRSGCNYNEIGRSLDWDRISSALDGEHRLELRNWRPGDSLVRAGSDHREKVKELFQKHRIPLWRRRSWPIVVVGDVPVWVAEFGPTAEFASGPQTRTALQIEWSPVRGR